MDHLLLWLDQLLQLEDDVGVDASPCGYDQFLFSHGVL